MNESKSGATPIGGPENFDGRTPSCEFCTDNDATVRTLVGGHMLCDGCYKDYLDGMYDEPETV